MILSLVCGAVLGIYSSGLTLLSLGVRIPRPAAALVDGVILTLGTIYVVFFAESFISPFQTFLITLGVPLAAWAGIMIADIALRKRDYDDDDLFDARGRYGVVRLGLDRHDGGRLGHRLGAGRQQLRRRTPRGTTGRATSSSRWAWAPTSPRARVRRSGTATGPTPTSACCSPWCWASLVTYVARRGRVRRQEAAAPSASAALQDREPAR